MIKWRNDIEVKSFTEVLGDFAETEQVFDDPPKTFKKGSTSETKFIFKHGEFHKYIVFIDDTKAIVPANSFCHC